MAGIPASKIHVSMGDTLKQDWPFDKNDINTSKRLDAVISNPPYSLEWDPVNAASDPRFINYGLAPKSKADFAFLLHSYHHLEVDGIMAIVLPHGVLFRGNSEKAIRQQLIKNHAIDTIIGLPDNMFFNTNISTIIMILKKDQKETDGSIQFIDASSLYEKKDKFKKFNVSHIKQISHAVINKSNIKNFSRVVSLQEIEANDYNLNISRYIENFEKPDEFDLFALLNAKIPQKEIDSFANFWNIFPSLPNKLFTKDVQHQNYLVFKDINNLDNDILEDLEIKNYLLKFNDNLNNLKEFIKIKFNSLNSFKNKDDWKFWLEFDELFFKSYNNIHLIDKYQLYQIIHEINTAILEDVNVLAQYNVTNNFVLDNYKDLFELIEIKKTKQELSDNIIFSKDFLINTFFKNQQQQLDEITIQKDELVASIQELKDNKEKNDISDEEIAKLNNEIKTLENQNKDLKDKINNLTKQLSNDLISKIKNLTNEDFLNLLYTKWTEHLFIKIENKIEDILNSFIANLKTLFDKYSETMEDLNSQIKNTQQELISLLGDLKAEDEPKR
ncbi:N-6 DNA methylase [Mycoplasma miroungirhinis]|uniref:site-specific DNA-methyltransferase (adenine-specific) n=1 Tax=Mycoplasma miroungirhinis TaxID=754516 RepID=A0A6M4JCJ6_9MOLU|nr:N-6 DNA methylase [Mycoplasma miroungirhinis]